MNTTTLSIEDLQRFCSTDDSRLPICRPFSQGEWTYATDGRLIIRVPRIGGVSEYPDSPKITEKHIFSDKITRNWLPLPEFPPVQRIACDACGGQKVHECSCGHEHQCVVCDGAGDYEEYIGIPVVFGKHEVSHLLLNTIKTLPRVQICESSVDDKSALGIRFDGGEGRMMPMRKGK